jgi:hypothetical protein
MNTANQSPLQGILGVVHNSLREITLGNFMIIDYFRTLKILLLENETNQLIPNNKRYYDY